MKLRTSKNPNEVLHKLNPTHNNLRLVKRVLRYRRNNQYTILNGILHGDKIEHNGIGYVVRN
jgi:hypothetical protein